MLKCNFKKKREEEFLSITASIDLQLHLLYSFGDINNGLMSSDENINGGLMSSLAGRVTL